MTVGDLFDKNYRRVDLKSTTWESYEVHCRLHLKSLAGTKLQDLSKMDVVEWKTAQVKVARGLSAPLLQPFDSQGRILQGGGVTRPHPRVRSEAIHPGVSTATPPGRQR